MSAKVSALCWRVKLPSTVKFVLMRLADFAGDNGKRIFPAISTVADECSLSHRAVQGAFRALTDAGILVLERASKGGRGHTSVYSLDLARLADLAGGTVPDRGGPSSGQMNGTGNHAPAAGFSVAENHAPDAGLSGNPAGGSQNPAPAAPEPSLTVKEEGEALCVDTPALPARGAGTQAAPVGFGKIITLEDARGPAVPLPDGWVLPDDWRDWAADAGQQNVGAAAQRFFDHWWELGAAKTSAGWRKAWQRWIEQNIERGYGNGQQRHGGRQRQDGGLTAYLKSEMRGNPGDAEGDPNDGGWRVVRG